jgi:hypothetical protein
MLERVKSTRLLAEKRILRLERALPILVDFAEDRVFFRGLNIALFTLVLLFIIRAGLFIVFLQFPLLQESRQALNLDGELGTTVAFGGTFAEPVKVHVTKTSKRIPVVGRNISLRVELALPDLLQLPVNGFENTITHLSGIALKGSFSIPGFPPKVLETPFVTGISEVTDINGDAIFRNLRIYTGVPGAYLVTAIDNVDGGRETKIGKVQVRSIVTSAVITEDGRKKLGYGRRGLPPRIITGEPLPLLQVKITGANKLGIPGKMCVLTSASRETVEFSNVGARPDVFHPRLVIINNPYSTLSNDQGIAEFTNVTFSTTIKHVRLWIVCDGRVANYEGSKDRSLVFTAVRKNEETHTLMATILQQPSTEVLEGESLLRQPSLLLQYRSISTGQLTPAKGVVAFAYPYMQAGFKSRNIMSPAGAAELEMLRESEQAVLGNLGRVKQLFNLVSLPADARGIANFTNLGFIRHGEAGMYTLGFASTGVFDELESDVIKVKTSVADVLWVSSLFDEQKYIRMAADVKKAQCDESLLTGFFNCTSIPSFTPDVWDVLYTLDFDNPVFPQGFSLNSSVSSSPKRLASAICNWPVCRTLWGSSSGFVMYDSNVDISQLRTSAKTFRASPSGVLSSSPSLYISDKYGRKLAGKFAVPITSNNVNIVEVPFKGASVSKLMTAEPVSLSNSDTVLSLFESVLSIGPIAFWTFSPPADVHGKGSRLVYHQQNLAPDSSTPPLYPNPLQEAVLGDKNAFISEMRLTGDQGSFFRIVNAPRGITYTTLAFEVEGVTTNTTVLEVFNADSDTAGLSLPSYAPPISSLCAHISIIQSPNQFRQDGSVDTADQDSTMSLLFLDQKGNEKPFVVQAVNSFGEPVQVDSIGMYAVDALGYVMVTSVGGEHVGLSSSYTSSLRGLGAATLTIGNYSSMTILREHMLAPIVLQNTNASGHAVFNLTRIRRAQNTWVKFAFVALYAGIKADFLGETDLTVDEFYDGPASCVSTFSDPISIDSFVNSIEWDIPKGSSRQFDVTESSSNNSEYSPLRALPSLRLVASKWAEKRISSGEKFPFVNVFGETDNTFQSVPAHVAVTAGGFERYTSTIEYWANWFENYLPQLENAIIPESFSSSPYNQDINQVASISSSVSSTLGLQLRRWTTTFATDLNSTTFVQIASRPNSVTKDRDGAVSAVATLPRIASTRGNVGVYNFVAFSGGVSSTESIQVSYSDNINAIVIVDHSAELSGLCPSLVVGDGITYEERDYSSCQDSPPCSGHGNCICGICICTDGYDGAEDCSVKYEGDGFGTYFSKNDPQDGYYKGKFEGLLVYDTQKAMRTIGFYEESFPRIIFPAMLGVGYFVDKNVYGGRFLEDFINEASSEISKKNENGDINFPISIIERINDTLNDAWTSSAGFTNLLSQDSRKEVNGVDDEIQEEGFYGSYFGMSTLKSSFKLASGTSGYRAFPVLYTCSGEEVYGWWFSPSWSRCSYDQVQVFADSYYDESKNLFLLSTFNVSMPSGILSFDHYNLQNVDKYTVFADDYRLFLGGVKTGCYRFKWAYAPQGSGDRQYRHLDNTAHQSQALSPGFSRPFRVLGVINSITIDISKPYEVKIPRFRVSRGFELPDSLDILLSVRRHASDIFPSLVDSCSDDVPTEQSDLTSALRKYSPLKSSQRCKNSEAGQVGGLDVTVSAINLQSRLEYSLYVPSQSYDCSRAYIDSYPQSTEFEYYRASFENIRFPTVVNFPPGPDSQFYTEASEIPAGNYKLKFRAYGEEILTDDDFIIALVDEPNTISLQRNGEDPFRTGLDENLGTPGNFIQAVFLNSSIPGISKACNDDLQNKCDTNLPPCFPSCRLELNYSTLEFDKNMSCLVECTNYFRSYDIIKNAIAFPINISLARSTKPIQWKPDPGVRGALIEAVIVYSPPRSNAVLSPPTSSALTVAREIKGFKADSEVVEEVFADFSSLIFESGISGLYILRFSVNTRDPVEPGFLLFDVTNPVQEVKVFFNNAPLSHPVSATSYASASALSRLIESSNLPQTVLVCIVPTLGRTIQSLSSTNVVTVRLLSDPSSNSQVSFKAPTKKGDGAAWEALLKGIAGKRQRFVYAEDYADEDRNDVVAGFTAFARSASNSSRTLVDPRSKGTPLGNDGCAVFSDMSFNAIGFSQRVAVVFSVLGVEGPPLILDLVTLLDANPVTTESLQNQIIIPLVIMMPAFGANSQLVDIKTRFICLVLSFVGLAIIASTSGIQFFSSLNDFYKAFSSEDVQYVYMLTVAWWVCYGIVIAYLLGVTLSFLKAVYTFYKNSTTNQSVMSVRERKTSNSTFFASLSTTSNVFDVTNLTKNSLSGFFESHMQSSIAYTRRLLPRIRVPIKEVEESDTDTTSSSSSSSISTSPTVFQIKARSVFASTVITPPTAKKLVTKPTLKERVQQFLRYIVLRFYHLLTSFESSYEAFFYPQRLIIAALVSLICCLFFSLIFVYGTSHLSYMAKTALDDFLDREAAAIQTAKTKILLALDSTKSTLSVALSTSDVTAVTSDLEQAFFKDAVDGVLDQIISETEKNAFGFSIPSSLASQLRSISNSSLVQSEDPAAEIIRAQRAIAEPWIDASIKNLRSSVTFGLSIAALVVTVVWLDFLIVYKRVILAVRRGNVTDLPSYFSWFPDRAAIYTAPTFVGVQAIGTVLSFLIFSLIFTILSFLLSARIVQDFLVSKALSFIGLTALTAILINFLRVALLKHIATSGGNISLRSVFSFLDIYFMFFNLITGAAVALVRFIILIPFYFILIMRPDIQALPNDPATAAYCSVVLIDSRYNNPIGKVVHEILRKILEDVRRKRLEKRNSSRDLRSIVLNPMSIVNSTTKSVNVSNTNSSSSTSTSSSSSSSTTSNSNSKRVVNRWWLFAMLATHPVLSRYRHREEEEKVEDDNGVVDNTIADKKHDKSIEGRNGEKISLVSTNEENMKSVASAVVISHNTAVSESSVIAAEIAGQSHESAHVSDPHVQNEVGYLETNYDQASYVQATHDQASYDQATHDQESYAAYAQAGYDQAAYNQLVYDYHNRVYSQQPAELTDTNSHEHVHEQVQVNLSTQPLNR